jgi:glycosyltransferase involved in cell wall biosynthesis
VSAVLLSHPHATAVANAAAAAFERYGKLALYITGVAAEASTCWAGALRVLATKKIVTLNRIVSGIAPERLRSLGALEVGARAWVRLRRLMGREPPSVYDSLFVTHDRVVAKMSWPRSVDTVYAYEDGALSSFERAAQSSMRSILDVPAPYYRVLEDRWREEWRRWPTAMDSPPPVEPSWKKHRKDSELRLANAVSVASRHTRASLEGAATAGPVVVVPYGFPVDIFPAKERATSGPFTVLAVGAQTVRKGTHYLLMAWKKAQIKDARLKLIGPLLLGKRFLGEHQGLFQHLAYLDRTALADEYRRSDLVAFPTLGDGFGLVMQEAMCCATPVVTTTNGGGPECIDDGSDGWIVAPGDIDALVDRLRFCAANRDHTRKVGLAARARAERWTWRQAGDALVSGLEGHR